MSGRGAELSAASTKAASASDRKDLTPVRAIVLATEIKTRAMIVDALRARGHEVDAPSTFDDDGIPWDLAVVSGRHCAEFCRRIRGSPGGGVTAILALPRTQDGAADALAAGANDVLVGRQDGSAVRMRLCVLERWAAELRERERAETALVSETGMLETVLEHVPDFLYIKDAQSRFVRANRAITAFWGLNDPADAIGKTDADFFPPQLAAQYLADEQEVVRSGVPLVNKLEPQDADGKQWFLTSTVPIRDVHGLVTGLVGVARDVTERREAEERLRVAEERYRSLVEQLPAIVYVEEVEHGDGRLTYISPRVTDVFGITPEEFVAGHLRWEDRVHPDDLASVTAADRLAHLTGRPFLAEYRHRTREGGWIWVREEALRLNGDAAGGEVWQGILFDLSDRKVLEDRLAHAAAHDPLTGLPNRDLLADRLVHALAREARDQRGLALLFADLDDFKIVNDSFGHTVGDQVLVEVTRRLGRCVRDGDTVARLGGDEFTLVLEGIGDDRAASSVAERVARELRRPIVAGGADVRVTASVGIAVARPGEEPEELLRRADAAMYRAKGQGKARSVHFDSEADALIRQRRRREVELGQAVETGQLRLEFQPAIWIESGAVAIAEALVRWDHPVEGPIAAAEFVPMAEETGLIVPIGRWVLREACRQARSWSRALPETMAPAVSVNVSAIQLRRGGFFNDVVAALAEANVPARCLQLEVTESGAIDDLDATIADLERLRALGVGLALDDFGAGYSGLGYLRRLPISLLKLDKSFAAEPDDNVEASAMVRALVQLARAKGLRVVAEAIETPGQLEHARSLGVDMAQGFLIAKPMSPDALIEHIASRAGLAVGSGYPRQESNLRPTA